MNPSELRIGNWWKHPVRGNIQLKKSHFGHDALWLYGQAVPLTYKRLEQAGFKKYGIFGKTHSFSIKSLNSYYFELTVNQGEICFYGYKGRRAVLKHVHTLQNLYFALKNEELNFKI